MNKVLKTAQIQFHNGREEAIDTKRRQEFDRRIIRKFFPNRQIEATDLFDRFGDWMMDYTNIHAEKKDEGLSDINEESVRIFTLWAENIDTREILCIVRGFFQLGWFDYSSLLDSSLRIEWEYPDSELGPSYPWAIISSMRTILIEEQNLRILIQKMKAEINQTWKKIRNSVIDRLKKGSLRRKLYVLSFNEVVHYTIICPSMDREIIEVLLDTDFLISGFMQILTSKAPAYDEATIRHHLNSSKKILEEE
ncbi:MAG: hypothetical protein ACFFE8_11745 [Candidatus Heimdallarchaeota archaeon]